MFSTWSAPKCYKQDKLTVSVSGLLRFGRFELLLLLVAEAGNSSGNR
jgi:hypothetical protein